MDPSQAGQGTPAPYGAACANCYRAKCKCIYRNDGNTCERCHRLNKECRLPARVRRRNVVRPVETRTALLEEKLEDLVSVLRSQAIPKSPAEAVPYPSKNASPAGHNGSAPSNNLLSAAAHVPAITVPMTASPMPRGGVAFSSLTPAATAFDSTTTLSPVSSSSSRNEILDHAAEEHLEIFRACMLNFFPFVYIPPSSTAKDLRHERPFLWLCIMCIAAKSTSQQTAIVGQIRQIICQRVVDGNERSIDLLLGIICYIGW
jgi:hypothetical protein